MKTQHTLKNTKRISFIIFATLMALVMVCMLSCSKDSNSSGATSASVMAANTSQLSSSQDFYVDGTKLNTSALAYSQSTGYFQVTPGDSHQSQFKASSTSTVDASATLQFASGGYYAVYFGDNNTANVYQVDRTAPQPNNARVRFINLSGGLTSNIDIAAVVGGKSSSAISALAAKASSTYYETSAVSTTFNIVASGSTSVLLAVPATLQAGKIYSIVISGSTSATLTFSLIAEN